MQSFAFCGSLPRMFEKIKNPKAGAANIALAFLYVAVLSAAFVGAVAWQLLNGGGELVEKIGF